LRPTINCNMSVPELNSRLFHSVCAAALALVGIGTSGCNSKTATKPVTNEYHGVKVVDNYQWLENAKDPEVQKWSAAQNQEARAYLDKLPLRPLIHDQLERLYAKTSASYSDLAWRAGRLFLLKFQPPAQQPVLVSLSSPDDIKKAKVILDPNELSPDGSTSIDWFVPSLNGKLVAVTLSEKGSEAGTLYIYETATGKKLPDTLPRVQFPTGGGSAAWNQEGTGIFYTRYPAKGERSDADLMFYQQVYFHKLGTPAEEDVLEFGKDLPRIAEIVLKASPDGRHVLATVANGDGGEFAHFLRGPSGQWKQVTRFEDKVKQAEFGRDPSYIEWGKDDNLYLRTTQDAPKGKIVRVPLAQPELAKAATVVGGSTNTIEDFVPTASGMCLAYLKGGPSELAVIDYLAKTTNFFGREAPRGGGRGTNRNNNARSSTNSAPAQTTNTTENVPSDTVPNPDSSEESTNADGSEVAAIAPPALSSIGGGPPQHPAGEFGGVSRAPNFRTPTAIQLLATRGDEILLRTETYTEPFTWWRYDPSKSKERVERTALAGKSPVSFDDTEVVRVLVSSKDGTEVPLNIIRRRGTRLTGDNPTLLTGYGGYDISLTPQYDFTRRVWLDQGGVLAIANLRGGGEFGEEWHMAGNLIHKQNVFDDFAACAEFLVHSNYTKPSRLAIEGGSNGGLLMGALLTQRPELFQAVVSHVGIYDMLRVELDPNGVFNVTEFGTVREPEQFKALFGYSPYHHVTNRTQYPAVLLMTGENDGRVNPAHSRKMAARLQAASKSDRPILLRTSAGSGHGIGTALNERIEQLADAYAFLFQQLGFDYSLVSRGPWSGAMTPTSAVVKARLPHEEMTVRLALSKSPLLKSPVFTPPVRSETNRHDLVEFTLTGLTPDTQYYYALEVNGRLDRKTAGELHTLPPEGPASFTFAFASCGRTGSTSDNYEHIRKHHPLFYMNMGDFHYLNISSNNPALYLAGYNLVLSSPQQAELYRQIPLVYMWDDHDYGGNNSNRKASSHEAARLTYDEYVPHYPLVFGDGDHPITQSFNVGRVKFLVPDLRSERDEANKKDDNKKSMLGKLQKEWLKNELLSANGKYPLICWVSSVPWIGEAGKSPYRNLKTNTYGYIHHTNSSLFRASRSGRSRGTNDENSGSRTNRNRPPTDEDHWSVYSTERREMADFIKSNHISGVCILHGDSHMLAADDGSNSDYATGGGAPIPVMCAAPLDQDPSLKGGPYSQGVYKTHGNQGCFGLLTIKDVGAKIDVSFSGRNFRDEEVISLKFSVPGEHSMAMKR
jgi:prolyl oligopeptidase PreP (S9A serine peptidase family)